ncbi:VOC family protein [Asanoa sp. WMMD1127]|uniref:VOC family protein n=1 Tax=Asanoa sp. WMMD1127 TaxID=3016107 RepID=UPI00241696E0|nr:VOC family protein [Asanoa sp. WMMD1127]MDG4824613.1 VOC family protein [Asanoa sp. WMMD1127]
MISGPLTIVLDAHDPARLARFWADLLGREVVDDALVPGDETQIGLRFVASESEREGLDRLHLHLTSAVEADQQRTVERALALGAHHLDVGQLPEEPHIVLADPEGNAFCVIPAGNKFLAGCGFLGEASCDGTRAVGLFWSAALGWPLVWDDNEETAVQSPAGGTKVSWGGPPVAPKTGRNRQRLEFTVDDPADLDRLVALGATRLADDTLADPDGNEFHVHVAG